jgi:hypothetical protein
MPHKKFNLNNRHEMYHARKRKENLVKNVFDLLTLCFDMTFLVSTRLETRYFE